MYIQGIDVVLYKTTQSGTDNFGRPIIEESTETISNVLPIQPSSEEKVTELNLTGKRIQYVLCIPKGDNNDWEDKTVEFFGKRFKTIGHVTQYVEALVPGDWNKQIKVEAYE